MSKQSRSRGGKPAPRRSGTNQSLAIIFLAFIATIAFANALPNNLTWDDDVFDASNQAVGIRLSQAPSFFTSDVWATMGQNSGLYRPLLLVSVALDRQLFGNWYVGYHLVNVLLHVLASLAVFGLVRYLLTVTRATGQPERHGITNRSFAFGD